MTKPNGDMFFRISSWGWAVVQWQCACLAFRVPWIQVPVSPPSKTESVNGSEHQMLVSPVSAFPKEGEAMEEQLERKSQQKARVTGWQGRHCSWLPDVVHCAILPTTQPAREVSHFSFKAFYISRWFCPLWSPKQPNESQYNKHSVRERESVFNSVLFVPTYSIS